MKKLSELLANKQAIVSDLEGASLKGGILINFGNGTTYQGPNNPNKIHTYENGAYNGIDGLGGTVGSDTWDLFPYNIVIGIGDVGRIDVSHG